MPSLGACTECGVVWLCQAPEAGRQPQTCPNDCQAMVLDYVPHLGNLITTKEYAHGVIFKAHSLLPPCLRRYR